MYCVRGQLTHNPFYRTYLLINPGIHFSGRVAPWVGIEPLTLALYIELRGDLDSVARRLFSTDHSLPPKPSQFIYPLCLSITPLAVTIKGSHSTRGPIMMAWSIWDLQANILIASTWLHFIDMLAMTAIDAEGRVCSKWCIGGLTTCSCDPVSLLRQYCRKFFLAPYYTHMLCLEETNLIVNMAYVMRSI